MVGSTVASSSNIEPFAWSNGTVAILPLPSGFNSSSAMGVSNDGTTIVGYMTKALSVDNKAFIWTQADGVQELQEVLTADGLGSELAGWTLTKATAITPDGNTIVGDGTDPQGQTEAGSPSSTLRPPSSRSA